MAWAILILAVVLFAGGLAILDRRWPLRRLGLRLWYRRTARQIRRLPVIERVRRERLP